MVKAVYLKYMFTFFIDFSERSMEVLFDDGKGSIFQESLKWLDSKQDHLQLSGALAVGNFARSGKLTLKC